MFSSVFKDLIEIQTQLDQIKTELLYQKFDEENNPDGILLDESTQRFEKLLKLDLDDIRLEFAKCQQKWDEEAEREHKEKEEYEQKLKQFMAQQEKLMESIFNPQIEFKMKKLPLFHGDLKYRGDIDFSWTAEEDCRKSGISYVPNLTAIKTSYSENGLLNGIQLVF